MEISFAFLTLTVDGERIFINKFGDFLPSCRAPLSEVHIAGENKDTHMGAKMANSSEGLRLRYKFHEKTDTHLEIIEESALVRVKTVFTYYGADSAISVSKSITNISNSEITVEEASAFVLGGIGKHGIDSSKNLYFTRFRQSHHAECQPERRSFFENGLYRANSESQKRISFYNVGSWSTKEELPQGIIEDSENGVFIMFGIECSTSWYYEIADRDEYYYLYLGGANLPFGSFSKTLSPSEGFNTPRVAISTAFDTEMAIAKMTDYRRKTVRRAECDGYLPTIFNEYMHLSWDSPTEENTKRVAPTVAALGIDYYVIDCGWHNEEPGNKVYPYVGQWKESHARFPSGIRKTTDFIRSLGMKAGLWIEPEIIGIECREMLEYYDEDCFLTRSGRKISVMGRYFLDYRNKKVREYMTESIRRMAEDYGADYIKFDYNEDMGIGTDKDADSLGDGLILAQKAFFDWVDEMTARFPNVIFEGCASGGMRMDHASASHFSLLSTSDQINYLKYPYIAANLLSAITPEQAAVWSYPVTEDGAGISVFDKDGKWVSENVSESKITLNMINTFLGRMHLASHLELLAPHQLELVREGVEYYNSLTPYKKSAKPVFPLGFSSFGNDAAAAGFTTGNKTFLALWCLNGDTRVTLPLKNPPKSVKIGYPQKTDAKCSFDTSKLTVEFSKTKEAVFLEIES